MTVSVTIQTAGPEVTPNTPGGMGPPHSCDGTVETRGSVLVTEGEQLQYVMVYVKQGTTAPTATEIEENGVQANVNGNDWSHDAVPDAIGKCDEPTHGCDTDENVCGAVAIYYAGSSVPQYSGVSSLAFDGVITH